jgi:predicted transcriptional regulator
MTNIADIVGKYIKKNRLPVTIDEEITEKNKEFEKLIDDYNNINQLHRHATESVIEFPLK